MVSFEKIENVAGKIGEQTKAQAVVLFGSHARNQAGMHSDVDPPAGDCRKRSAKA
jgi:predicted nucleotidyltransferase